MSARLLGEQHGVEERRPRAARVLGNANADRARLDEMLPQRLVEARLLSGPYPFGARLGGKQLRERIAQ